MTAQERPGVATVVTTVRLPTTQRNARFYAGVGALGSALIIIPVTIFGVPLLGLPTAWATILFAVLAAIPDVLCIVAVGLLGKEFFLHFVHRTKSALQAVVDRRFHAEGTIYRVLNRCFLIFPFAERHVDRLQRVR